MTDVLTSSNRWIAAAAILLVGALLALGVGTLVTLVARRVPVDTPASRERVRRMTAVAVYAIIAIAVVVAIIRLVAPSLADAGLSSASVGLLATLPNLLVALVLLVAGVALATAVRAIVARVLERVEPVAADVVGALAYWSLVVLTVLVAADQAGIETGLVQRLVLVLVAAVALALAIALGLASRETMAAVVAGRHVAQILAIGDEVEVDGLRGVVTALGHASVRLAVDDAEAEVPNPRFLAAAVIVRRRAQT